MAIECSRRSCFYWDSKELFYYSSAKFGAHLIQKYGRSARKGIIQHHISQQSLIKTSFYFHSIAVIYAA